MPGTRELAQAVISAALDHCRKHAPSPESWMPAEYLALESDDQNLVDWEIDGILK